MYIRFVINELDYQSGRRQGLFHALNELEEDGQLNAYEKLRFEEIDTWFVENLKEPTTFSRSSKYASTGVALSWFKDRAKVHIARMRELAQILEDHGVQVETIMTEKPGYIVYEDAFQIVAEPFRETIT